MRARQARSPLRAGSTHGERDSAAATTLDDYTDHRSSAGRRRSRKRSRRGGRALCLGRVARGESVECVITNEAKPVPTTVVPQLECVVFDDDGPDVAVWGYENDTGKWSRSRSARGTASRPATRIGASRPSSHPGDRWASSRRCSRPTPASLVWHLDADDHDSIVELRRAVPRRSSSARSSFRPTDPGDVRPEAQRHGRRDGRQRNDDGTAVVGVGEGTASETAGAGTQPRGLRLERRVHAEREGRGVRVNGTKVDGTVANDDVVVCTFTNHRKGTPPEPEPRSRTTRLRPTPPAHAAALRPPRRLRLSLPLRQPLRIPAPPPTPLPPLDLQVVKTASPTTVTVGQRITWTMTVTNRSSVEAADVNGLKVADPRSFRHEADLAAGLAGHVRAVPCNLGRLAPGASATVVAVTVATQVGVVVNIVRVWSEEIESNYRNNVAAALARVVGPFTAAAVDRSPTQLGACRTLVASPRSLQARRASIVRLTAYDRRGRPRAGVAVAATGAGTSCAGTHRTRRCRASGGQSAARRDRRLRGQRPDGGRRSDAVHHAARRPRGESDARHRLASQRTTSIGVPSGASRARRRATTFETRTQPCDTAWPRSAGLSVPWMPTIPSSGQSVSRDEALVSSAYAP